MHMKVSAKTARSKPHRSPPDAESATLTVGFRLSEQAWHALNERAASLGRSVHELARDYVVRALSESEEPALLREGLEELGAEVIGMRQDLTRSAIALLISAGKVQEQDAFAWALKYLGQPCSPSQTP